MGFCLSLVVFDPLLHVVQKLCVSGCALGFFQHVRQVEQGVLDYGICVYLSAHDGVVLHGDVDQVSYVPAEAFPHFFWDNEPTKVVNVSANAVGLFCSSVFHSSSTNLTFCLIC